MSVGTASTPRSMPTTDGATGASIPSEAARTRTGVRPPASAVPRSPRAIARPPVRISGRASDVSATTPHSACCPSISGVLDEPLAVACRSPPSVRRRTASDRRRRRSPACDRARTARRSSGSRPATQTARTARARRRRASCRARTPARCRDSRAPGTTTSSDTSVVTFGAARASVVSATSATLGLDRRVGRPLDDRLPVRVVPAPARSGTGAVV